MGKRGVCVCVGTNERQGTSVYRTLTRLRQRTRPNSNRKQSVNSTVLKTAQAQHGVRIGRAQASQAEGWLLEFYILATSEIISGLTCVRAHSWQLYSAAPVGNQATSTRT